MKRIQSSISALPFKQGLFKSLFIFFIVSICLINFFYFKGFLIKYSTAFLGTRSDVISYGPHSKSYERIHYRFENIKKSFNGSVSMNTLGATHGAFLKEMILSTIPGRMKARASRHIDAILLFSEQNRLDPLWVISIIWVESHFKENAKSYAGARGLMQIMPKTGLYLNKLLGKRLPVTVSSHISREPVRNIELGSFYLQKLLKRFSGNYTHATVAYNMGPTYTRRALRKKKAVGKRNQYLNKVRRVYKRLSKPILEYQKLQTKFYNHYAS